MNALNLCFYSLLVLAVICQGSAKKISIEDKLDNAATLISGSVKNIVFQKRSKLLSRLSEEIQSQKNSGDRCSMAKASKLEQLRKTHQNAESCPAIQNFEAHAKQIVQDAGTTVVQTVNDAVGIVSQIAKCVQDNPTNYVQCIIQTATSTVQGVTQDAGKIVHLSLDTINAIINLIEGLPQCIQAEQAAQLKFDNILAKSC